MYKVSSDFKKCMKKKIRNRAHISVGIGVVNQEAQKSAKAVGDMEYFSVSDSIFDSTENKQVYACLDENFIRANGKAYFAPEETEISQYKDTGIITKELLGVVRFAFSNTYAIKGLTLYFPEDCYPTELKIKTQEGEFDFTNAGTVFTTTEYLGETSYIEITPVSMVGGAQRFRICNATMGVGINFGNSDIQNAKYEEFISSISEEVSSEDFSIDIFDKENKYNVDDDNSFINFLEIGQNVSVSEGIDIEEGKIEWVKIGELKLDSWSQRKGMLHINACDSFAQMDDEYAVDDRIFGRTAYEQAVRILSDLGYEPDEYIIDDYLKSINIINPMPTATHKECLQVLANACRCIVYQNRDGNIVIRANFANVIDPEDLSVTTNGETAWSKSNNVIIGADDVYADFTENFAKADGNFYFVPESGENILNTGYASNQISDEFGDFDAQPHQQNPQIAIQLPAGYIYYCIDVDFEGNPPEEMIVHTFYNGEPAEDVPFRDLENKNILFYEFSIFDKMVFEFTKTKPHNRVVVSKIKFGDSNDYILTRSDMMSEPYGYKEGVVKSVGVKIYTFENDEEGNAKELEDSVYYTKQINTTGENKFLENPLISNGEWAKDVAEWLCNYFANNVSYSVDYRGDPRLNSQDIIHMESEVINNLQVEIEKLSLNFNGAWSGQLEMRKALKLV